MLAVANHQDGPTRKINSVIYEYSVASDSFVEFKACPRRARGWEAFSVGGRQMLAVANSRDDSTFNINSVIYEYSAASDSFVEFQSVPTQGTFGWEAFSVGGRQMLAVANAQDDSTHKINSVIYEYSAESDSFEEFQSVPTKALWMGSSPWAGARCWPWPIITVIPLTDQLGHL